MEDPASAPLSAQPKAEPNAPLSAQPKAGPSAPQDAGADPVRFGSETAPRPDFGPPSPAPAPAPAAAPWAEVAAEHGLPGAQPGYAEALRRISALWQQYHARVATALDINGTALEAMEWLEREGPLTPSELAERLGVTPGAVTGMLGRLEATGHAHRERHAQDGRSVQVVANPASIDATVGHLLPMILDLSRRAAAYSPEEIALVERFLGDVEASYRIGLDALEAPPR